MALKRAENGDVIHCLWFQTILLQDRQQKNYCVSCQEMDSDIDKDNPGTPNLFSYE